MKERPILFNTEMVLAILEGRKTLTRRPLKDQGSIPLCARVITKHGNLGLPDRWCYGHKPGWTRGVFDMRCPFGRVGDRLYVRETWGIDYLGGVSQYGRSDCNYRVNYRAGGEKPLNYQGSIGEDPYARYFDHQRGDWWPSIHMPKWAVRIWLEITDIRVERLQDITRKQAKAEGYPLIGWIEELPMPAGFAGAWNQIYGNWEDNPWVWVIEFKRIQKDD